MVFSHFDVLHILIRSEFHLQLPLNIIINGKLTMSKLRSSLLS